MVQTEARRGSIHHWTNHQAKARELHQQVNNAQGDKGPMQVFTASRFEHVQTGQILSKCGVFGRLQILYVYCASICAYLICIILYTQTRSINLHHKLKDTSHFS